MRTSAPGIFAVGDIAQAYNESAGRHLNVEYWGDGWDEQAFEIEGEGFTVWYGKEGVLVGVLSHTMDDDYERGRGRIESGEPFSR